MVEAFLREYRKCPFFINISLTSKEKWLPFDDQSGTDGRTMQLPTAFYDAIVAVTILDHITQEEGHKVAASLINALKPGGFVFIETFTIHDPGAKFSKEEGQTISETASFVQYYFQEGELADWFSTLETVRYEEFMKYDDSHGEPHYHGLARLIAKKLHSK